MLADKVNQNQGGREPQDRSTTSSQRVTTEQGGLGDLSKPSPLNAFIERLRSPEVAALCARLDAEVSAPGYVPPPSPEWLPDPFGNDPFGGDFVWAEPKGLDATTNSSEPQGRDAGPAQESTTEQGGFDGLSQPSRLAAFEEHLRSPEVAALCARLDAEASAPGYVPPTSPERLSDPSGSHFDRAELKDPDATTSKK